jgi:mRNA-degrading endonuclease RelE of RelBE toxin-antitoxin system
MYQLLIEKQVQKQLEKIPVPDYQRVKTAINDLAKTHALKDIKN